MFSPVSDLKGTSALQLTFLQQNEQVCIRAPKDGMCGVSEAENSSSLLLSHPPFLLASLPASLLPSPPSPLPPPPFDYASVHLSNTY